MKNSMMKTCMLVVLVSFYRREVLRKWQDKFGLDATYKCLLEILVTSQHIEGAKAVCNVLRRRGEYCIIIKDMLFSLVMEKGP